MAVSASDTFDSHTAEISATPWPLNFPNAANLSISWTINPTEACGDLGSSGEQEDALHTSRSGHSNKPTNRLGDIRFSGFNGHGAGKRPGTRSIIISASKSLVRPAHPSLHIESVKELQLGICSNTGHRDCQVSRWLRPVPKWVHHNDLLFSGCKSTQSSKINRSATKGRKEDVPQIGGQLWPPCYFRIGKVAVQATRI